MTGHRADQPLLIEQDVCPPVGLILDRHQVFVDTGQPIPDQGERATALCGLPVLIGPPPVQVLPGIPATHVADCPDCGAVLAPENEPTPSEPSAPVRLFIRRRGTIDVHIVPAVTTPSGALLSLCGRRFGVDDDLEHLTSASGAPCVPCLLRSLSMLLGQRPASRRLSLQHACRSCSGVRPVANV